MAGGFQFHRQPMQNAWGGSNNNGQFNNNNQSNQGNQYPNQGGNFHNGPPPGNYNFNGQHPGHHMGFSQAPSFNSYGKSDGPMDPPRGQQNPAGGRQGQGPPGQPPRLFSPPPSGQPGSRPGSSSGPSGQPPRVFSPGPSQGPPRVFSPGPSQGQPLRVFSPGPESGPHGQQRVNPFPQGMGYDPARLQAGPSSWITNRRVDLPGAAYAAGEGFSSNLPQRPAGGNKSGKNIVIRVNQYKVVQFPTRDIYQYDIAIGAGAEKMGKIMAVWKSKTCQNKLREAVPNAPWLWDGNKLAWTSASIPSIRFPVDLDAEKGRAPRPGKQPDVTYVKITQTKIVRMTVIEHYLSGKIAFDNSVFEAINFLDHLMRQGPSEAHVQIKRSFFPKAMNPVAIDNVITAVKGVYSSIRLCDPKGSSGLGTGLAVNVDVANSTFWTAQYVHQAARNLLSRGNRNFDYRAMTKRLESVPYGKSWTQSEDFKELRKLSKLKFKVKLHPKADTVKADRIHTIKRFTFDPAHGKAGSNAKTYIFSLKDRQTNREENISVYAYFKRKYGVELQHPEFPLIQTERDGVFPMEACEFIPHQRYQYKLTGDQTSAMIKFAVTRPKERIQSINQGVNMLNWGTDRYLNHFGLKIDQNMSTTNAKLLQNPEIQFKGKKINPGTSGRWVIQDTKFFKENTEPLKSWAFVVVNKACDDNTVREFSKVFVQTYISHGGRVETKEPPIVNLGHGDLADTVSIARQKAGTFAKSAPQILFFILPGRDSMVYERLKRNMECRFGMVSQMLAVNQVFKKNAQYCSNVCMKVNAKLGGVTCKIAQPGPTFPRPTMVIGADVSHASPGSIQASTCAITMSMDADATRYAAFVQTNGHRVEMITPANIDGGFMVLFKYWVANHKTGPSHIYYFRDGVSEGQYSHVLAQEIEPMKKAIIAMYGDAGANIRWTVTVCSKRHHIRFFPKDGDRASSDKNGNALPGTLVERDVTHPFEYDFYLSSHSAIQGTARPVHYHVIKDDAQMDPTLFQNMIYKHCYQYARSTTPVSLYPAVYYAHLASNRARCHEPGASSDGPKGGQKYEEAQQDAGVRQRAGGGGSQPPASSSGSQAALSEARPLVPLACDVKDPAALKYIRTSMWYI